jgi:ribosomal protein S18 acetylase RimI-like enzyme
MATQLMTAETIETLPMPPELPGYVWRPARIEDVSALHQMLLAADEVDDTDMTDTLADMQTQFDDPWSNPLTDSLIALTPDGQVAAFARTFMNPQPEEENRVFLWVEVHPDQRGRGLEDFVLDWAEARGVQRLRAVSNALPRLLRSGVPDNLLDRIARLEARGFRPVRYFYRMRRDLSEPIPDVRLADGLTLRTFTPDLSRRVLDAFNEAFRDHWSFELITDEDWQQFFIERSSFRPDLTFVVMDGDQVAGASFNTISLEANAREGISEGWVAELAVRRAWRKRGVATALLCATMRAFKAEGLDFATLGVDTENPSGALRLYERVGFRPVKRFIQFEKPVL